MTAPTLVPTRHPDRPRRAPGLGPFAALLGIGEPSPQRWRALGESLLVGDEPMDRLVEWMYAEGMATTRPLFDRALHTGIDSVPAAPAPLREFFELVETTPDWVDPALLRQGERVFRSGGTDGLYFARDVSFLGGYLASGFNKTLLRTGALEKGPARRFAETLQWAMDVSSENGMDTFGAGYRSTLQVRFIHALVRRHVAAMPDWRGEEWGVPINQTDMAATLVGALLAPFVGGMALGIVPSPRETAAAAHLTRYVGWLIGVQEQWLPTGFRDGVAILHHCLGAITNPDETSRRLARPMADDPLHWHHPNLPRLRGRIARAQHLSVASAFLGPKAMRILGLPYVPPWYPALRIPVNLVRSGLVRLVPGGADRAAVRGRREQEAFLRKLIGDSAAVIGASAPRPGTAA
ncbi:oxygenase MpaB family protein [Nocardia farcinica]|uniref:oxygenase MpaB family protein n=1 Tax=Nocardia farcinica TaxID=37329 RepID=UPI0018961580|nr:oxygenase MpaB family protein [Nocardia farcinica]MBF6139332.1 DUF2236 domain-containing protein [Nocardia farcinica]MBF6270469.1 DUF2236 domain-containing protein [Nocardia farcinica]MBF6376402.1 DUF2236 domain-containing protein [Nocardia farcinica]MCZ9325654.1 oxygenase MpaB family protein [Nocardia farcinica]